jgi:hypothetical protein
MEDETDWQRQLLIGLVVLVAVGALIGGIVAVVSITAADLAGIDDTPASTGPVGGPIRRETDPAPTDTPTATPSPTAPTTSSSTTAPTTTPPADTGIRLVASPRSVDTYERINLTGTYEGPSGTVLRVQRKQGTSWSDFADVMATVNGGSFATYVETGQSGMNLFRVIAVGRDDTSNIVRVQVS